MRSMAYEVVQLDLAEVDRVEPLWNAMVTHHDAVVEGAWPVRTPAEAWRRRRAQYVAWLTGGEGRMLVALDASGAPAGYAVVLTRASGPTWDMGERVGDLESLAVAEAARGTGVGTQLIAAARELLRAEGVEYWGVSVVEANEAAARLYEREGFGPFYRSLLGRV